MNYLPPYPDVLGCITHNRIRLEALQYATGVSQQHVHLNQPFELVIILQSLISVALSVRLSVRAAATDHRQAPIALEVDSTLLAFEMLPGEVCVLRLPMVMVAPTFGDTHCPLQVAVRYRIPADTPYTWVRPQRGGVKPSHLNISPYKLRQLQAISYEAFPWHQSSEVVSTYVHIDDKTLPYLGKPEPFTHECIWSTPDWQEELSAIYRHQASTHQLLAHCILPNDILPTLEKHISQMFGVLGMMLHPAEAQVIARLFIRELNHYQHNAPHNMPRWFWTLCQLRVHHPQAEQLPVAELIAQHLLDALLHDALDTAFSLLDDAPLHNVLDLPSDAQTLKTELLYWLANGGTPLLQYLYLPLVLGSVLALHTEPPETHERLRADLSNALIARLRGTNEAERQLLGALTLLLQSFAR